MNYGKIEAHRHLENLAHNTMKSDTYIYYEKTGESARLREPMNGGKIGAHIGGC